MVKEMLDKNNRLVIATTKSWNIENAKRLFSDNPWMDGYLITDKNELITKRLDQIDPRFIFFPHWSWIIPEDIYTRYECVVFHMTDLPFGRGGSPLQNLLVRGIYDTKISAIRVAKGLDTGPIYLKEPLDISVGNADEILKKASDVIFHTLIPRLLRESILPKEQSGKAVVFSRRRPEQSEIPDGLSQRQLYDYIRMLDGEGYPNAFRYCDQKKVLYTNARLSDGTVYADARFEIEKEK